MKSCRTYFVIIVYLILLTDLYRRALEVEEREFLVDLGVVTETQSNLGLVALSSEDVYQVMYEDYPSKFKEYMSVLEQRSHATSLQQIKEEKDALTKKVTCFIFIIHPLLNIAVDLNSFWGAEGTLYIMFSDSGFGKASCLQPSIYLLLDEAVQQRLKVVIICVLTIL